MSEPYPWKEATVGGVKFSRLIEHRDPMHDWHFDVRGYGWFFRVHLSVYNSDWFGGNLTVSTSFGRTA